MVWRRIRANKSTSQPQTLIFVDTETRAEITPDRPGERLEKFRLGVAIHVRLEGGRPTRREVFRFGSTDQFWSFAGSYLARHRPINMWAHNAGFDCAQLGLLERIESQEFRLAWQVRQKPNPDRSPRPPKIVKGVVCLDDPPTILTCRHISGSLLKVVDTLNFWRTSLAELGKSVGLDKLPMPDRDDPDRLWYDYCQRDVEILERCVLQLLAWHREHDLGMFRATAPACAYGAWRHRFKKVDVILHDEAPVKKLERAGYYGGQLEVYYLGEVSPASNGTSGWLREAAEWGKCKPTGPVHKLDVTSLYPHVMSRNRYPAKLLRWSICADGEGCSIDRLDFTHIARVRIDSPDETYPYRVKGQTLFCRGKFWTVLAGPELQRAIDLDHVTAVGSWARYDLEDLFSRYVDYFWQLRYMAMLSGRTIEAGLCKLFLNALYGKFGQRNSQWLDRPGMVAPIPWGHWVDVDCENKKVSGYRAIGWNCQQQVERTEHANAFPAIAAFVTAHGREYMRQLRLACGQGNYYYQGVDSLYVSPSGLRRLQECDCVRDETLGLLRLEETAESAEFMGHNHYRFGGREVIASIRSTAKRITGGTWEQDEWDHLSATIERGPGNGVRVRRVTRTLSGSFTRGTLDQFGWVSPLRVNE